MPRAGAKVSDSEVISGDGGTAAKAICGHSIAFECPICGDRRPHCEWVKNLFEMGSAGTRKRRRERYFEAGRV